MDFQNTLTQKDFDPIHLIKQVIFNKKAAGDKPMAEQIEETLRNINNFTFKLQMQSTESSNLLNQTTQLAMNEIQSLSQSDTGDLVGKLELDTSEFYDSPNNSKNNTLNKELIKNEFIQLHQTDQRINRCKKMSQEIEHFEHRISKVEEYIRQNKFLELTQLIEQLQESLKVVRDVSFFEKQKQRIERYDKMILGYLQTKEKEHVYECGESYKQNGKNIRALVTLQAYFKKESSFIEQLINQKLIKDFEQILSNQESDNVPSTRSPENKNIPGKHASLQDLTFNQRLYPRFTSALVQLVISLKQFLSDAFYEEKSDNSLLKEVYEKLLLQIVQDYKEKLVSEFTNQLALDQQTEIYETYYIDMMVKLKTEIPRFVTFDNNVYLLFKDLYEALLEKYKRQIDAVTTENFEFILEKDKITDWQKNLEKITYVFQRTIINNIEITQCYELGQLISTIQKACERFIMQLCYHIGQYSNKKIHFGAPNPNSSTNSTGADDQQCILYEQKFKWQNIFDFIQLHLDMMVFFDSLKQIDKTINESIEKVAQQFEKETLQKRISAFIAQKNTLYFKQLQKFLSPNNSYLLFSNDQASKNLEFKVFKQELLQEAIKINFLRAFVMPIFKELSNINIFLLWKQSLNSIPVNTKNTQKQQMLLLPEPGEYIRKIGEHFISFIHKLDSVQITQQCDQKLYLYHKYCQDNINSSAAYWIGEIGSFLVQTVSSKYMKINFLSMDGEKQLISDIIYMKKLIQQFCNLPPQTFETVDSILIALVSNKKDTNIKHMIETGTTNEMLINIVGLEEANKLQVNESIVKAVISKRKS